MGVWAPTRIKRVIKVLTGPSTCPVHAMTDAGEAIVKLLGNPQGPHALAREWIGTRVAAWLGLPTFDMALVAYDGNLLIPGISPTSGPSIAFRFTPGRVWSGSAEDLRACAPAQIAGVVVSVAGGDGAYRRRSTSCLGRVGRSTLRRRDLSDRSRGLSPTAPRREPGPADHAAQRGMTMRPCYYSLLQYRPDASREEGLNVAIVVVRAPDEVVVATLDRGDLRTIFERLDVRAMERTGVERRLDALAVRLRRLGDATERGLRDFAASETGPIELLPPHAVASDEPRRIAEELFEELVRPRKAIAASPVRLADPAEPNRFTWDSVYGDAPPVELKSELPGMRPLRLELLVGNG